MVTVDVEAVSRLRTVNVPSDLAAALSRRAQTRRAFEALSYSAQRRYVLAIEGAKSADTRRRRVEKTVAELNTASVPTAKTPAARR